MIELPIPSTGDEFENIVADLIQEIYGHPPSKVGRKGQSQKGIDFILFIDNIMFGIQCKKRGKGKILTEEELKKDINSFSEVIKRKSNCYCIFWLFTTLPSDSKVQFIISELNLSQVYPFEIRATFWDDIGRMIQEHERVMRIYYGKYLNDHTILENSELPVNVSYDKNVLSYIAGLSEKWREIQNFSENSVFFDHGTLSFSNDVLSNIDNEELLSNFHFVAIDQLLEALIMNNRVYYFKELIPHKWQTQNIFDKLENNIIKPVIIPPALSDSVERASLNWADNFWNSRSSKGLLSRLLHMQIEITLRRSNTFDEIEKQIYKNMLKNEKNEEVKSFCHSIWSEFSYESLCGAYSEIPNIGRIPKQDWEKILEFLENEGLSLIYWMFYRTLRYQTLGIMSGGTPYL